MIFYYYLFIYLFFGKSNIVQVPTNHLMLRRVAIYKTRWILILDVKNDWQLFGRRLPIQICDWHLIRAPITNPVLWLTKEQQLSCNKVCVFREN